MNSFWDFVVYSFWIFVWISYLMVLFSIIGDIFRDHTLNGWLKALWIIFLVFVPFLTALVYLIARGPSMARRRMEDMQRAKGDTDAYIRTVATASSPSDEIAKAKTLLDNGTITQAEFDSIKARSLASL